MIAGSRLMPPVGACGPTAIPIMPGNPTLPDRNRPTRSSRSSGPRTGSGLTGALSL